MAEESGGSDGPESEWSEIDPMGRSCRFCRIVFRKSDKSFIS